MLSNLGFSDVGKLPINNENPAGLPSRYETEFQELEAEIAKLESLTGESVNWPRVTELSSDILKTQSKDFLVASYLSVGLLQCHGLAGLCVGLRVIKDLIADHWSDAFPPVKRLRARKSALDWLSSHSEVALSGTGVSSENASDVLLLWQLLSELYEDFDEKFEGDAPGMLELHKWLKDAKRAAAEYAPKASEAETAAPAEVAPLDAAANSTAPIAPSLSSEAKSNTKSNIDTPQAKDAVAIPASVTVGHALAGLGASPIAGSEPCGVAVKYEPDFEALEAELAKQESLTAATVDWPLVVELASRILRNQSKDLLVSAYLSKGLWETQGYLGLAVALTIVRDMIQSFWADLYPPLKRLRARESALAWISEKVGTSVTNNPPAAAEQSAALECAGVLTDIFALMDEHIEGGGPGLLELSRPLKEIKKSIQHVQASAAPAPVAAAETIAKSQPAAPVKVDAPSKPKPARSASPSPAKSSIPNVETKDVGSDNEAKKALRSIQDATRKVGGFWLGASLSDAKPYRLNRIATWLMIETCPPVKDGVTQLGVAPIADRKKQLQVLFDANNFAELLPQLEQTLTRAPFWLDGQRMAAQALQALGAEYANAYQSVVAELRSFLERVEGIQHLCFSDSTKFASDETLLWISSEVLDAKVTSESSEGGAAPWLDVTSEARTLVGSGKLSDAVALFEDGIRSAASGRLNWQWRLALAKFLGQAGKVEMEMPILQSLSAELHAAGLIKWEAGLAKDVTVLLYQAAKKMADKDKSDSSFAQLRDSAYLQLCSINPITAITIQEK